MHSPMYSGGVNLAKAYHAGLAQLAEHLTCNHVTHVSVRVKPILYVADLGLCGTGDAYHLVGGSPTMDPDLCTRKVSQIPP